MQAKDSAHRALECQCDLTPAGHHYAARTTSCTSNARCQATGKRLQHRIRCTAVQELSEPDVSLLQPLSAAGTMPEVHHAQGVSIPLYRGRSWIRRITGHVGSAVVQLRGPRQCTCHALRHCVRRARRSITGAARRLRCTQPGRRAPARLLPARCGGRRPGTCGAPRCLNLHLVRRENRGVRTAETTGLAAGGLWRT